VGQLGFYDLDSAQLSAAKGTLDDLSAKLRTTNDKALMKSAILGAVAAVNTTWAISTTAACGVGADQWCGTWCMWSRGFKTLNGDDSAL
jgi:hypothetical protein